MKQSTTINTQITILTERGMNLDLGNDKCIEVLGDIGYFRLGSYCFPFEQTYPCLVNRDHKYKTEAKISDVVNLYYFDVDLRNILSKYINRIEVNFRTKVVYEVSNIYITSNTWFVDPAVMERQYIDEFDKKVYTDSLRRNKVIRRHHFNYINDKYAPAWKTLEFIPFGGVLKMFKNIKNEVVKENISKKYGINTLGIFERYISSIVELRNTCAHGGVLFDFTLSLSLMNGPALRITNNNKNNLNSVIEVILFILKNISEHRAHEMKMEIDKLFNDHHSDVAIRSIIEQSIGYKYS